MLQLIVFIIFILSLLGIAFILYRKIPLLLELPKTRESFLLGENFFFQFKENIKKIIPDKIILQKILSRIRILTLKAEKIIDNLLQKLRKKSREENSINKNLPR